MQFLDRGKKHSLVFPVLMGRAESAGLVCKPFQGGLVGLHFLDITRCKGIVTLKLLMAVQKRLHSIGLNVSNLTKVRCLFVVRRSLPPLGARILLLR